MLSETVRGSPKGRRGPLLRVVMMSSTGWGCIRTVFGSTWSKIPGSQGGNWLLLWGFQEEARAALIHVRYWGRSGLSILRLKRVAEWGCEGQNEGVKEMWLASSKMELENSFRCFWNRLGGHENGVWIAETSF